MKRFVCPLLGLPASGASPLTPINVSLLHLTPLMSLFESFFPFFSDPIYSKIKHGYKLLILTEFDMLLKYYWYDITVAMTSPTKPLQGNPKSVSVSTEPGL